MKDVDLRGTILQQFYDHRKKGPLGIGVGNVAVPTIPAGCDEQDFLRIADQLFQAGLLKWRGLKHSSGQGWAAGVGDISAAGVDVIEGGTPPPIPIHLVDQSQHVQHFNISGSQGGVQIGGDHSTFQQNITQQIEKLIEGIDKAPVPEAEKQDAKKKLGTFLATSVASSAIGAGVKALLHLCEIPT